MNFIDPTSNTLRQFSRPIWDQHALWAFYFWKNSSKSYVLCREIRSSEEPQKVSAVAETVVVSFTTKIQAIHMNPLFLFLLHKWSEMEDPQHRDIVDIVGGSPVASDATVPTPPQWSQPTKVTPGHVV